MNATYIYIGSLKYDIVAALESGENVLMSVRLEAFPGNDVFDITINKSELYFMATQGLTDFDEPHTRWYEQIPVVLDIRNIAHNLIIRTPTETISALQIDRVVRFELRRGERAIVDVVAPPGTEFSWEVDDTDVETIGSFYPNLVGNGIVLYYYPTYTHILTPTQTN